MAEDLGPGWFDSHCHLQDRYLEGGEEGSDANLAEVLRRATEAGVHSIVCVGTDPRTSTQALTLAEQAGTGALGAGIPRIWATAGLHPHEASAGTGELARLVDSTAGSDNLVAVGECGLDYHYDHSSRDDQRTAFAEQIALAHRHDLALVIHSRSAWDDLFDVLAAEGVPDRTVLHCFTGGPAELTRCLDAGMFVSFSGIVTFKNAAEVREAAALCPLDRLLVETDSPFLAPPPHRGRQNEPAYVGIVGAAVAEAKGVDPGDLAESAAAATARCFGL
jgi:TatD DNase family protein